MRLTIISKARAELAALGLPPGGSAMFPTRLDPALIPVWKQFLRSASVRDIAKRYPDRARYYTAVAFISALANVSPELEALYDPIRSSNLLDMRRQKISAQQALSSMRILEGMIATKTYVHSSVAFDNFLRAAVDPSVVFFRDYVPRSKTAKGHLDKSLHAHFKRLPKALRPSKTPPQKARFRSEWVSLHKSRGVQIDATRACLDTLILRITLTCSGLVFHGSRDKGEITKLLTEGAKL